VNKSPLKTSGTVAICVVRESCTFSGHPYIGHIARLSLRQHGFLVYHAMLCRAWLCYRILSVHLSVTLRYVFHTGWNVSKIISRPNSLRPVLGGTPKWVVWCNGNTPKLGLNRGDVTQQDKKPARNGARYDQGYYYRLIGTHTRLVPKSVTLGNLEEHIQRVCQVFTYTLLSREQLKVRTSTLACTFIGSIRTQFH